MGETFEIRCLSKDFADEQIEVYIKSFQKEESYADVKDTWVKKHYENPVHESYVFGAFDGDRLVSINAYMPMKYHCGDKTINVIQSCESGTLPEYRGKGLWSKVVKYAINYFKECGEYDFLIGFPNYENSYGGFVKMNWNHDMEIYNYIMIANGKVLAKSITGKSIPFAGILGAQKCRLSKGVFDKYTVTTLDYDDFSEWKSAKDGFCVDISRGFIEWKKRYKKMITIAIKNNITGATAIGMYSITSFRKEKIALLFGVFGNDDNIDKKEVMSVAIQTLLNDNKELAFIRTWAMPGSDNELAVRKLGFIKSKHHNPFITYSLKSDIVAEEEIRKTGNWKTLTFLDLD